MVKIIFITLLLVLIADIFLAFLVLLNNYRAAINRNFFIFIMSVVLWTIGILIFSVFKNKDIALFGIRTAFTGASFIAYYFFKFSRVFPEEESNTKKGLYEFIPVLFFTSASAFSSLVVKDVEFKHWGWNAVYGKLYYLFGIYFAIYIAMAFYQSFKKYKVSKGNNRLQFQYVFSGFLLAVIFGSFTNLVFPVFFHSSILSRFGPLSSIFIAAFTTYAIVKHRFLDIRLMIKKSTIYFMSLCAAFISSLGVWFLIKRIGIGDMLKFSIPVLFAIILFKYIEKYFTKIGNKYLYANIYNAQQTLKKLTARITTVIDIDELSKLIL
ncbi:MAG: histidine kinase N-terminal 7TM domain-containing protein, partial [Patescibacteria group bacterium]